MANTNCLEGMKCPKCGSLEPFDIVVESIAKVYDDGVDCHKQTEWDWDSVCYCCQCDFGGEVKDFKTAEDQNAQSRN